MFLNSIYNQLKMGSNDVVIQLASFNSSNKVDNAEWSNHTKESVSINQGDTVVVSKAYLDTRLSNSGDIIIVEDLEVSLELYFYWINDGNNGDYNLQTTDPYPQPVYRAGGTQAKYCVMSTPYAHPFLKYNDGDGNLDPASQWTRQANLYADGRPYLVVYVDDNGNETPYTQWWNYTIKAGSYTPDGLASILTTAMANVRKDDIRTLKQGKPSQWLQEDTTDQIWDEPFLLNTTQWVNNETYVENDQGTRYTNIVTNYIPIIPNDGRPQPSITPYSPSDPNAPAPWIPPQMLACKSIISDYPIQNPNINLPSTIDDPQNFYLFPLKKLYAGTYDYGGGQSSSGGETHWVAKYNFPILGATEISLVYNDTSSVFEWQYLHTPILQSTTTSGSGNDYSEVVGLVKTDTLYQTPNSDNDEVLNGNITMCKLDRKSGVMFRTMNPPSFWFDLLGFDPSIVVKDAEVMGIITTPTKFPYKRFLDITTGGFLGIADNFDQSVLPINEPFNPLIVNPPKLLLFNAITDIWEQIEDFLNNGQLVVEPEGMINILGNALYNGDNLHYDSSWFQSISTVPLQAIRAPLNQGGDNSGHQLVEITGYQSNFLNEDDRYEIKAIVSSYYVSPNSFTTSPFQDTYIYTHVGAPISINTYNIRIIDPLTMQKVKTLGTNSTIYLQITKAYSDEEQKQVEV